MKMLATDSLQKKLYRRLKYKKPQRSGFQKRFRNKKSLRSIYVTKSNLAHNRFTLNLRDKAEINDSASRSIFLLYTP